MTTLLQLGFWARKSRKPVSRFVFHETGILRDRELELVCPSGRWVDALMQSARHPDTYRAAPKLADLSRRWVIEFLRTCPLGRQEPNQSAGAFPTHHFWMVDHGQPDFPIAGAVSLRIGNESELELHYGHFGYHVYPAHRGRHFAERSVRLLLPLARSYGIDPIWITCNPENHASRRTCENLGGRMMHSVELPLGHPLRISGDTTKCCFRLESRC